MWARDLLAAREALEALLEDAEASDDREAVEVALEVADLARRDSLHGRWIVCVRTCYAIGMERRARTCRDHLRAGEEVEEGEEEDGNAGHHIGRM